MERLSAFQASTLEIPETMNLALLGARGGGKTTAGTAISFQHVERYGSAASVLIVRWTYKALADFEDELLGMANQLFGGSFTYNRSDKIMRLANGAKITLLALERESDYFAKVQGKNVTLLIVDEVTAYQSERLLRILRSNLRAPQGVPTRVVYLGNPGGPLHARIFERHVRDRRS